IPEVQRTAQAEIDSVVGQNRLPTLRDHAQLPYVVVVLKEVFRWFPVAPLGVPHVAAENDFYEGYFIPKGAHVIYNTGRFSRLVQISAPSPESVYRAMLQDPNVYPEPMKFKPERFLPLDGKQPENDPYNVCFGFGRRQVYLSVTFVRYFNQGLSRLCPGRF
ncbi:cytochrome P450, partial [Melanogaster broomeanus]